jgi:hypothetical protein
VLQVSARVERHQGEVSRLEQEMAAEAAAQVPLLQLMVARLSDKVAFLFFAMQEAEVQEITSSFQRLEKVVCAHLVGLQKALESSAPAKAGQTALDKSATDMSVLSGCFNDENMLNVMQDGTVV